MRTNIVQLDTLPDEPPAWEAEENYFWEVAANLNLEDVVAHPEAYLEYVAACIRKRNKDLAQEALNKLRNEYIVVPVPSYREGAAICCRPGDKCNLMYGLQAGGLDKFELADGSLVSLTAADLAAIGKDAAAAETLLQEAKQLCWMEIDGAANMEDIEDALAVFWQLLAEYGYPEKTPPAAICQA